MGCILVLDARANATAVPLTSTHLTRTIDPEFRAAVAHALLAARSQRTLSLDCPGGGNGTGLRVEDFWAQGHDGLVVPPQLTPLRARNRWNPKPSVRGDPGEGDCAACRTEVSIPDASVPPIASPPAAQSLVLGWQVGVLVICEVDPVESSGVSVLLRDPY